MVELAAPYYFATGENYDATVTPRIMTKRGLQVGGQFRYLFGGVSPMQGEIDAEVLPNDRVTDTTRWGVAWKHNQQLAPWAAMYWNIQEVSDDTYFSDLADRITVTSQTTLPREFGVNLAQGPWSLLTRVQAFQTLQDPNAPIAATTGCRRCSRTLPRPSTGPTRRRGRGRASRQRRSCPSNACLPQVSWTR